MNEKPIELVAYHEAGHAVVGAFCLGLIPQEITIRSKKARPGYSQYPSSGSLLWAQTMQTSLYDYGPVLLAGFAAEDHFIHLSGNNEAEASGALGDLEEFENFCISLGIEPSLESEIYRNLLETFTERTMEYIEGLWSYIQPLAIALLDLKTIRHPEIMEYLPKHTGRAQG